MVLAKAGACRVAEHEQAPDMRRNLLDPSDPVVALEVNARNRLPISTGNQPSQLPDIDHFADEVDRSVAKQQVRTTRMERVNLRGPLP